MSMRYKGALLSATPPTTSTAQSVPGLWTLQQQLQGISGSGWPAPYTPIYIEDVFSTYLYTGTGATQTITNGIDLSGKGGLVWVKRRDSAVDHGLSDTAQGASKTLSTNQTSAASAFQFLNFLGSGFSVINGYNFSNATGGTYASWTFREQAKFFDVVTYTGNGSNRTIAHNLGSVPGCIIVKRTDTTADWQVYHRSLANTEYLVLNTTAAKATGTTRWNSTTPTSTEFSLGTDTTVNANGGTYVAYLFAHDAGGFGLTGTDNVISCGLFTSDSAGSVSVNIGYEPQWILYKTTAVADNWLMFDVMRGMPVDTNGSVSALRLQPNTTNAEQSGNFYPTSTGFASTTGLGSSQPYIYIAIRRGPMKVPTSGTSVFGANAFTGNDASNRTITTQGVTVDAVLSKLLANYSSTTSATCWTDRLRGGSSLGMSSNQVDMNAYWSLSNWYGLDVMDGYKTITAYAYNNLSPVDYISYGIKRAPNFFDVVCDTGTGSSHTITHNLGVVPELMIRKKRDNSGAWIVYANNDNTDYLVFDTNAATVDDITMWNDTSPTASVFTVGTNNDVNQNANPYLTYLFATCPGVSKVGSYTGTGTTKQIDCGFTGGARFVMIKRVDSTGDWYVWDSTRGIVSGNDPYFLANTGANQVTNTDYVDTYSAGFEISSTAPAAINANGGTFIFLAIA